MSGEPLILTKKNKRNKTVDVIKINKDKERGLSVKQQFALELRIMHVIKTESL